MAHLITNPQISLDDVLLIPQKNNIDSRLNTDLQTQITATTSLPTPIISTNMATVTGYEMAYTMHMLGGAGALHRFSHPQDNAAQVRELHNNGVFPIIASIGVGASELDRAQRLADNGADVLLIDIAHGHSDYLMKQIEDVKRIIPNIEVIAGNVCTYDGTSDLINAGADAVRVGIGGGANCTTRKVTGHGAGNLSALISAVEARDNIYHSSKSKYVPIILDGGIKNSGHIVKALAFGADAVCIGNLFAGTKEAPGELLLDIGTPMKKHYGMSSYSAMNNHLGGVRDGIAAEGIETIIPYKGSVEPIFKELVGGIRSGLTYTGASNIDEFRDKAVAQLISPATGIESFVR